MKIALVHDHLAQDGGAEQVLRVLKEIYPQAPIFTLLYDKKHANKFFANQNLKTSFLQRIPFGVSHYQWWVGFMPMAIEGLNLVDYDLVISSASSFAKGVITKPGSQHICYCHTPTRFLWVDTHSYIKELRVNSLIKIILPFTLKRLRLWDRLAADRVDFFVANSRAVKRRIEKYYGRESEVIYPPVEVDKFYISPHPKTFYLAGGRLVAYKKIDLVVQALARLGIPLKVFGDGPEMKNLKKLAQIKSNQNKNDNIELLGKVTDEQKRWLFANCIAYINPQEEDFGITAVEAMAAGRPVIAYRGGGAKETIVKGVTGEFFDEQTWEDLADRIIRFQPENYNSEAIRKYADKFSVDNFRKNIIDLVTKISDKIYT